MNDRLKFRVWDLDKKEYNQVGFLYSTMNENGIIEINCLKTNEGGYYYKNFVIEQSTGLKDKNGKLGYHKDFIKNNYGDVFLIEWNSKECAYCLINIIYLKSGIELEYAIRYDSCSIDSELVKEWEVIGNIHQDSHLLGGK